MRRKNSQYDRKLLYFKEKNPELRLITEALAKRSHSGYHLQQTGETFMQPTSGRDVLYHRYQQSRTETASAMALFSEKMAACNRSLINVFFGDQKYDFSTHRFLIDPDHTCKDDTSMQNRIYRTHLLHVIDTIVQLLSSQNERALKAYFHAKILKNSSYFALQDFQEKATAADCLHAQSRVASIANKIQNGNFKSKTRQ